MRRKIFPALLDKAERRLLAKLSTASGCSQSGVIRDLILREVAWQRISCEQNTQSSSLAKMCRDLIMQLLRDKSYPHRALLLKEVRRFLKAHGR
ncbi:MAG: hypothetical protein ABIU05_20250 [Nitrospirales bacterium]